MAKILIADDNEDLRDNMEAWLSHQGDDVDIAVDGTDATLKLQNSAYDVLILDWEMPGKTGPEIARDYRASGGNAIVILLTGRTELNDKEEGFEAGVDDYMTKPFHLKELSAKLKALLRRVQAQPAAPAPPPPVKQKQILRVRVCPECDTIFDANQTACPDDFQVLQPEEIEFLGDEQMNDKYEVTGIVGRGGMSVVFKARHRALDKEFAIKFMDSSRSKDQEYLKRFQLEAQSLSKMNHPNIVAIHDYGIADSRYPFIVMDFIKGISLWRALNRFEPFPLGRCLAIFKQACAGIGHAHRQGIIHRDLKPANIILEPIPNSRAEIVKIVDFGVAKQFGAQDKVAEQLTKDGHVFGTTTYMSPEHCLGRNLDPRSDVYSFGCIMYEVLTGRPPFQGDNILDTLQRQISEQPIQLHLARGKQDLPYPVEHIVHKALSKNPADRFQSMDDLRRALDAIQPPPAPPPGPPPGFGQGGPPPGFGQGPGGYPPGPGQPPPRNG